MRTTFNIPIPNNDVHALYLSCFKARCKKLSTLFELGDGFYFSAKWIENDFIKPLVHPTVLYITMLQNHEIHQNSVIHLQVLDKDVRITVYEFNDVVSGITTTASKEHLIIKSFDELPQNIALAGEHVLRSVNKLRRQKDDWELLQMVDAIENTRAGFKAMNDHFFQEDRPNESQLESLFMKCVLENGFMMAYAPICAGDQNGAFIHYSNNNCIIHNNVLLDCGSRNPFGYCADITRCYSKLQSGSNHIYFEIYDVVDTVKKTCEQHLTDKLMQHETPSFSELHTLAKNKFKEHLPSILKRENVLVDDYFTHFIGHSIGLEVHDIDCASLLPGCVFTLEPGLYFYNDPDEQLRSIGGIRIEDMYYITDAYELVCLSAAI
jgi:Xaa-Pro aminopeptidase